MNVSTFSSRGMDGKTKENNINSKSLSSFVGKTQIYFTFTRGIQK